MSIESKIRFKAISLYVVTGIVVVGMIIFLYGLKGKIGSQKENIDRQHFYLSMTNKLISTVGEAQASASMYVSTKDTSYIEEFSRNIASIDSLIQILGTHEPEERSRLEEISDLLTLQHSNITALNHWFNSENPITGINKRIQIYDEKEPKPLKIVTVTQDTLYHAPRKKNFFQRIKAIFSPDKDSTYVVTSKRVDTMRSETAGILTEVGEIARDASKNYEQNIHAIEQQVGKLITADREISTQISSLLLELHQRTLNSVVGSISQSEDLINANYTVSMIGGIFALALILVLMLLIIYDVNKGKEARDKLREVMESRHRLLLSVSHDIKSPLGSILGYLEIGKLKSDDVKSMQNSARHILALLENLLEFSSLEQGSLTNSFSNFSPEVLCDETGQMFKPLAEAKGLSFTFKSDAVRINSDLMKIKQIIINLVSNAIKYTRKGKIDMLIIYSEGNLTIRVADTGAGIPEEKLPDLFLPFTRIESNNALSHGSGLGMYVVKGLVDLLGGTIEIKSKVGEGTTVKVNIPCQQAEYEIPEGKKRIAVFDDDPVLLKMVHDMLHQLGHEVVEKDYDIVLTDMEMDDVSGMDILASAGDVPVIVMTGRGDFTQEKAKELGFDGFLPKPFTINNLQDLFGEVKNDINDFLGDDREAILELFRKSTDENFVLLKEAVKMNDFTKAQALCHKMFPMFAQLGYPVEELRKMDIHRGDEYEGWQGDVEKILAIKV